MTTNSVNKESDQKKKKIFVLDTNVLLHNPEAIASFQDNEIIIPITVLEELDPFKKGQETINRNARMVSRFLDSFIKKNGDFEKGVSLNNEGVLKIFVNHNEEIDAVISNLGIIKEKPDNRIIAVAKFISEEYPDHEVTLVTKDINVRIKAHVLGIKVEDFETDKITHADGGSLEIEKVFVKPSTIDTFFQSEGVQLTETESFPNKVVILKTEEDLQKSAVGKFDEKGLLKNISLPKKIGPLPLKNLEQKVAGHFLLDEETKVVNLLGRAGTGKTLLALAAAIKLWEDKKFENILVARPIMPMGSDIGYLPGDKDQKLKYWMQPIFDNLKFLFVLYDQQPTLKNLTDRFNNKEEGPITHKSLIDSGVISLEPLTFIRGRTISNSIVIVDESQNATPHEIKTVITRIGRDSKIIFTGDTSQIDNPYLDENGNGLAWVTDRSKKVIFSAHVSLTKTERSDVAEAYSEI